MEFCQKLKKIKTSEEIVNINIVHHYFSKSLQGCFFFLLLLPHPSNQLRHHSGIQNFGNASVEQRPKLIDMLTGCKFHLVPHLIQKR